MQNDLTNTEHAPPVNRANLPTFEGTLLWPREIETRMEESQTMERAGELGAAIQKAIDEKDPEMLEMFDAIRNQIEEHGLDEATRQIVLKRDETGTDRPERIHKLSEWLELAKLTKTPFVPFEMGPVISIQDFEQTYEALHFGNPENLPASLTGTILPWIQIQQDRGWMWRFEWCATQTIKEILGTIRPEKYLDTTRVKVPFSLDERSLHCMWDTGLAESNLLARPWIRAAFEKGFPVEFRVFRTGRSGKADGWAACNYYIQRGLSEKWRPFMMKAVELAQNLEKTAEELGYMLPEQYTTDWIVTTEGEILMLEAGPGFTPWGGAHPCCFSPENGPESFTGRYLLDNEEGAIYYCPPQIQPIVDQIKEGAHPIEIAGKHKLNPLALLNMAAIQGHRASQAAIILIQEQRFLEKEQWEATLENS